MKEEMKKDNSSGIAGVVLGILAVMSGAPGILLGFVGFWFSLNQHKKSKNKWSKWGLGLNIAGFVLGVILVIYVYTVAASAVAGLQGVPL